MTVTPRGGELCEDCSPEHYPVGKDRCERCPYLGKAPPRRVISWTEFLDRVLNLGLQP